MGPRVRSKSTVAAVVVVLVLAACSGGEDPLPSEAGLGGDGAVELAFDPDRVGPPAPIEGAVAGGTVTAWGDGDFAGIHNQTMDPTDAYTPFDASILSGLVTRSLTQYVYDPEQGTMVVVPDIATDIGTPNADFTQWTFTIRDGVRFEDGTEVTAADVAYGVKRSLDRDKFPDGPTVSNEFFLEDDKYKGLYTTGTQYAGVVVEGNTLTIKMERPFPDMPYWGTFPAMGPIPEGGSEPARYTRHPLATGPYKLAEYTPGKSLTLVRNDQWDPDTDPGRHAYPDRYEFRFNEPQKQIDATILDDSALAQTMLSYTNVLPGDFRRARQLGRLALGPGGCTYSWHPDNRAITDVSVRRAIGYAWPYKAHAAIVGAIAPTYGASIFLPGTPGRQDYTVLETEPGQTDPDKARELLREAGFAPGKFELEFPYITDQQSSVQVKDLLVKSFEAAGFKATPYSTTSKNNYQIVSDPNAPLNLRPGGWCPNWPSGSSWIPPLFGSEGGGQSHFAEPAVDAEMERIAKLPVDEQPAAWGALEKWIMTDYYPAIVTRYVSVALPYGSRIDGVNTDNWGMPTWKDIYVVP
ncbi:MAG: hypothetical protein H0V23_09290 [Nocardioidaceae bacterium]|nr:hypothetical protein [Nocardioidaceae bacterium]